MTIDAAPWLDDPAWIEHRAGRDLPESPCRYCAVDFKAPKRVMKQSVAILKDRSLTNRERANRAITFMVPLLFADSGMTPPEPFELAEELEYRESPKAPTGQSDEPTLNAILRNEVIG